MRQNGRLRCQIYRHREVREPSNSSILWRMLAHQYATQQSAANAHTDTWQQSNPYDVKSALPTAVEGINTCELFANSTTQVKSPVRPQFTHGSDRERSPRVRLPEQDARRRKTQKTRKTRCSGVTTANPGWPEPPSTPFADMRSAHPPPMWMTAIGLLASLRSS